MLLTFASQLNLRSATVRNADLISESSVLLNSSIAFAISAGSAAGTSVPQPPIKTSLIPPMFVATMGNPDDMASSATQGKPSPDLLGRAKMSAEVQKAGSSA